MIIIDNYAEKGIEMNYDLSKLYDDIRVRYKDNPEEVLKEYRRIYRKKEQFITYSYIMWWGSLFVIWGLLYFVDDIYSFFKTESMFIFWGLYIVASLFISTMCIKFYTLLQGASDLPDYGKIKEVYKTVYLRLKFGGVNYPMGLRSGWAIKRWYYNKKIFRL
ncbi:hypothetical protein [Planktosalinus lacus]|uniref:Uncharacterized protein n=1 Tax=Planktosalinus lacus TaxID=1526573 RepID=A0A8J2YBZ2_9FLAO|nr:hypothetical protein [Planktosalinus lacus]GGD99038.1 hypothetical protein GCM10011312_23150 [Planktosalinus lacus]